MMASFLARARAPLAPCLPALFSGSIHASSFKVQTVSKGAFVPPVTYVIVQRIGHHFMPLTHKLNDNDKLKSIRPQDLLAKIVQAIKPDGFLSKAVLTARRTSPSAKLLHDAKVRAHFFDHNFSPKFERLANEACLHFSKEAAKESQGASGNFHSFELASTNIHFGNVMTLHTSSETCTSIFNPFRNVVAHKNSHQELGLFEKNAMSREKRRFLIINQTNNKTWRLDSSGLGQICRKKYRLSSTFLEMTKAAALSNRILSAGIRLLECGAKAYLLAGRLKRLRRLWKTLTKR